MNTPKRMPTWLSRLLQRLVTAATHSRRGRRSDLLRRVAVLHRRPL